MREEREPEVLFIRLSGKTSYIKAGDTPWQRTRALSSRVLKGRGLRGWLCLNHSSFETIWNVRSSCQGVRLLLPHGSSAENSDTNQIQNRVAWCVDWILLWKTSHFPEIIFFCLNLLPYVQKDWEAPQKKCCGFCNEGSTSHYWECISVKGTHAPVWPLLL